MRADAHGGWWTGDFYGPLKIYETLGLTTQGPQLPGGRVNQAVGGRGGQNLGNIDFGDSTRDFKSEHRNTWFATGQDK